MKRFSWVVVLGLGWASTVAHAAYSLDQLMTDLARNVGGRARFVEKQYVALLDKPVVSSGEMVYSPPDRLEKHTLLPKPETMVLDKDTVSVVRDKRRMSINLSSRPEAQAFVESIRSTLAGNRDALEAHYRLELKGERSEWTLILLPSTPAISALVQRITITGSKEQVGRIEYLLADGDRSELAIEAIEK